MSTHASVISALYAGGVETIVTADGRGLRTAIWKRPIEGADLTVAGIFGDQSSESGHRTPDRALHIFPREHYCAIERRLDARLPRPSFGENISADGLLEDEVFVGDHLRIGRAILRITQPTERCRTIGLSLGLPKILKALHDIDACGFYLGVVEPGPIAVGDRLEICKRTQDVWSIRRLHHLMFNELGNDALVAEIVALPELSIEWKARVATMRERLKRGQPISSSLADMASS